MILPSLKRAQILLRLLKRDGLMCRICNGARGPLPAAFATVDHIIPRARGGSDDLTNLQLAHFECNQQKGDKLPPEPDLTTVTTPGSELA